MEKTEKKLFYLGIEDGMADLVKQGACGKSGFFAMKKLKKQGCPIQEKKTQLTIPDGSLCIYYALLPEYAGRGLLFRRKKIWKKKHLEEVVKQTIDRVKNTLDCREIVITPKLIGRGAEAPVELWAAYLYGFMPFERVCVTFSKEGGTFEARWAILLLAPYLKRMREVIVAGEESPASRLFADYLYYEYGLVMMQKKKVPEGMLWLDLGRSEEEKDGFCKNLRNNLRINNAETLKFLDTAVKNGYNTES